MKQTEFTPEILVELLKESSKHSDYQLLHPCLSELGRDNYVPAGKKEVERQSYMERNSFFSGRKVLDIGANTGYFSFGALQAGASHVTVIEGNTQHAIFIAEAAKHLGIERKLDVRACYFDFSAQESKKFDVILCLNVLHHLGDDFGDCRLELKDAISEMVRAFRDLAGNGNWMWFQLGFNWKGNKEKPLFREGLKAELIEFVGGMCKDFWSIEKVAVYDPATRGYEDLSERLLARYDDLGEFLNRPLFLLHSLKERSPS